MSESTNQNTETVKTVDPVRKLTNIALIIVIVIFSWYLFAKRIAPWTDQARIQAYVIPIAASVSGKIVDIYVENDQTVQPGDKLFKIDDYDYKIAVDQAKSSLEAAGQEIGVGVATVVSAQAQLVEAENKFEYEKIQSDRVFELEQKHLYSKSDGDKARIALKIAKLEVSNSKAKLDKAKLALGKAGNNNPRIKSALANLKKAQINLSRTLVEAPLKGGITNLQVQTGYFASVGAPLMTFVGFDDVWIQADIRENNLGNIKNGQKVEIAIDAAPGKIFNGTVSSIGFAVKNKNSLIGGLSLIKNSSGWLRETQRFPVMIDLQDEKTTHSLRHGGQVTVIIYTGNNWLLNSIGSIWIRVLSYLSYIY